MPAQPAARPVPARFIWGGRREQVFLRRAFSAARGTRLLLRLFADTGYELFLDGRLVVRLDEWCNARDYDLTAFLGEGLRHLLAIKGINHGGHKGVACQLVLIAGRRRTLVGSDQRWRACDEERWGWTMPGFDDRAWQPAQLVAIERCGAVPWQGLPGDDPSRLVPVQSGSVFFQGESPKLGAPVFPAPPVVKPSAAVLTVVGDSYRDTLAAFPAGLVTGARVVRCDPASGSASHQDGVLTVTSPGQWGGAVAVVDLGDEIAGFLRLRLDARGPALLRLRYSESLGECLDARPPWRLLERMVSEEVEVVAGRQEWESRSRQGFRFVRIEVADCPQPLAISGFAARRSLYPVAFAGHFACSDPGLERIWRVGRDTLHRCMQEHYLDGIRRDRFLWVGDARLEAL
ncbi:MAG: family 78 glycoside hydrolase catalytic domain, partial [Acidobacteria bacterium]|nr:family 78 glycoside hydrolase catalytic domain [Acidobacteriota bacterium]